jgi:hypothetical protein
MVLPEEDEIFETQPASWVGFPAGDAAPGHAAVLETVLSEVPSPTNRLGVRSGGEGGATPAFPAQCTRDSSMIGYDRIADTWDSEDHDRTAATRI